MKFGGGNGGGWGRLHGLRVDEQHCGSTEHIEIRPDIAITPTI